MWIKAEELLKNEEEKSKQCLYYEGAIFLASYVVTEVLPIQQLLDYIYINLLPPCMQCSFYRKLGFCASHIFNRDVMSYVLVANSPEDVLWKIIGTASAGFSLLFFDVPQVQ